MMGCVRCMQWLCCVFGVDTRLEFREVASKGPLDVLDRLPFQGFARHSGIQVFRLYSRVSPVTDRNTCGESANRSLVRRPRGVRSAFYYMHKYTQGDLLVQAGRAF